MYVHLYVYILISSELFVYFNKYTLPAPLSLLTFTAFLITTLPHAVYALQTPTCCLLLVFVQLLPPVVSVLQPPQSGTHSHLAFATLPLPIPFVTASSRPSSPPSDSPKCLRFGQWLTLCTLNIHLLPYLLTYLIIYLFI